MDATRWLARNVISSRVKTSDTDVIVERIDDQYTHRNKFSVKFSI